MKFEAEIILALQSILNDFWLYFFRIVTLFGSLFGFVAVLMFIFAKHKRLSYCFALTYAFGVLFNKAIKHIIMRPRPFVIYESILNLDGALGFSMPSGHSCSAALIAVFLCYYVIKFGKHRWSKICVPIFAAIYLLLIMLSRIALGAHYLTDVIAGMSEGILIAILGIIIYNLLRKKYGKTNDVKNSNK